MKLLVYSQNYRVNSTASLGVVQQETQECTVLDSRLISHTDCDTNTKTLLCTWLRLQKATHDSLHLSASVFLAH
jgi:hypothetical protein